MTRKTYSGSIKMFDPRGSDSRAFLSGGRACLLPVELTDLGGSETLSAGQQQLVKRCAMISVACELMEKEAISGQPLNAIAYGTLTGHLTRTLNALGLKREPIDVTPVLNEYLSTLPAETQDLVAAANESEG